MLTAISAGVSAPMSSPTGAESFENNASSIPAHETEEELCDLCPTPDHPNQPTSLGRMALTKSWSTWWLWVTTK